MQAIREGRLKRDAFGLNPILQGLRTAEIAVNEIGLKRDSVLSILLYYGVVTESSTLDNIKAEYGEGVAHIIHGLVKVQELYKKNPVIESENFRNLLISFSEDMRVILIMIADRVNLMRQIRDTEQKEAQRAISEEASYLYAPLAHKLGLYKLKSELEDLSLKYLEHDAYYLIKTKLNATKEARDAYIQRFVQPLDERLKAAGLHYHMKGRTKSIHSIWQKMKKQKCNFEGIYDLFAIRIIIDSPIEREKMLCWQVYSIVTDMYQPNPKRLRDWLSVPKTNGYESLHITVLGPESKWVEVQIRTERMDEVAERGLAAHWRYKGVKSEGGIDEWLGSIRSALENNDDLQLMDQFKMDLYECLHAKRRLDQVSQRRHHTGLRLSHPYQYRQHLCRWKNQRESRFLQGDIAFGRHHRNPHAKQPEAQTRLAEHRQEQQGQVEDTSRLERDAGQGRPDGQGIAGTKVQESQAGNTRIDNGPPHQEDGLQGKFRVLQGCCRRKARLQPHHRAIHRGVLSAAECGQHAPDGGQRRTVRL